jgi:hypothetical protein
LRHGVLTVNLLNDFSEGTQNKNFRKIVVSEKYYSTFGLF